MNVHAQGTGAKGYHYFVIFNGNQMELLALLFSTGLGIYG